MKEINIRSLNMLPVQGSGYTDHMKVRIYDHRCDKFWFQELIGPMEITSICGNVVTADKGIYVTEQA